MSITTRPTELDIPVSWAESGTATDPGATLRTNGWIATDAPAWQHMNWLLRTIYRVERWLDGHLIERVRRLGEARDISSGRPFFATRHSDDDSYSVTPVSGTPVSEVATDGDVMLVRVSNTVYVYDLADMSQIGSFSARHSGNLYGVFSMGRNDTVNNRRIVGVFEYNSSTPAGYLQTYGIDLDAGTVTLIQDHTMTNKGYYITHPVNDGQYHLWTAYSSTLIDIYVNGDGTIGSETTTTFGSTVKALAYMAGRITTDSALLVAHNSATSKGGTANTILEAVDPYAIATPRSGLDYVDSTYTSPGTAGLGISPDGLVYMHKANGGNGRLQILSMGDDGSGNLAWAHRATLDHGQNYPQNVVPTPDGIALCLDGVNGYWNIMGSPWNALDPARMTMSATASTAAKVGESGVPECTDGWHVFVRDSDTVKLEPTMAMTRGFVRNSGSAPTGMTGYPWLRYWTK